MKLSAVHGRSCTVPSLFLCFKGGILSFLSGVVLSVTGPKFDGNLWDQTVLLGRLLNLRPLRGFCHSESEPQSCLFLLVTPPSR